MARACFTSDDADAVALYVDDYQFGLAPDAILTMFAISHEAPERLQ